ncbi:hypothetical protein CRG98_003277 [Punica granatum]|uniref:PRP1 splicing factor N-terminal domain-containing protein n=1 Tax=Punica granatum TaxID=22663 RepID=A0A2I0L6L3_PUNGR|nr:hypothetical protein CRG98_003277 [Punica granatum]
MPPRKTANQRRVVKEDELDRRIERIIDTRLVVALECRLDVVVDRLAERMRALMEAQHEVDPRRKRVPNPTTDLEDVKYDSYSERDVNIFIEEDPSDDAFFLAGGNGEPEFDEDDEGDDKGYDENWQFDEFEGNDVGVFASAKANSRANSLHPGENDAAEDVANRYLEKKHVLTTLSRGKRPLKHNSRPFAVKRRDFSRIPSFRASNEHFYVTWAFL